MTYYAVYMPGGMWMGGFHTPEAAYNFIAARRCPSCRYDAAIRPYRGDSGCDAEWDVWPQADVDKYGPFEPADEVTEWPPNPLGDVAAFHLMMGRNWALHLGVSRKYWHWGYSRYGQFGFGPLFLFTWD